MKITVKLLGELRRFGATGAVELEAVDGITPAGVRRQLGLPDRPHLVLVNDERIPRDELETRALEPGAVIAFCPPIKGG